MLKGQSVGFFIVAAIVLIGVASYYGLVRIPASVISAGSCAVNSDSNGDLLVPLLGYYECAPAIGGQTSDTMPIPISQARSLINVCNLNTPSCQITTNSYIEYCLPVDVTGTYFGGQACGKNIRQWPLQASLNFNSNQQIFIQTLNSQTTVLTRTYTPFTLWDNSPTSGRTQVFQSKFAQCSPPSSAQLCQGDTTNLYCTKGVWNGVLTFYQTTNYFTNWVIGPVQGNLVTYNGQPAFCSGPGNLYSVGKIQFTDSVSNNTNSCYSVPGQFISTVACCPGSVSGNLQCGSDFQFHQISNPQGGGGGTPAPQCNSDLQCPGQGAYIPDFGNVQRNTAVKYTCQAGACTSSATVKSACADSNACPTGTVCSLDPNTGIGSCIQIGTNPLPPRNGGYVCSNGAVVSDASKCAGGIDYGFLIFLGILAFVGLVVLWIFRINPMRLMGRLR